MFKTRPLHVTRSAPVVGTSQNDGDDDDGKRDCGGEKGSHGLGGSRGGMENIWSLRNKSKILCQI